MYFFLDLSIKFSNYINYSQQKQQESIQTYEWIKNKIRTKGFISLEGKLSKIAGKDTEGFDHSSIQNAMFNDISFLRYKRDKNKVFICEQRNHVIRSINTLLVNGKNRWNGTLKIEVGQPEQYGYSNSDGNPCKLMCPRGFDWDLNDNMYICNQTCICKVDGKSNQVSFVAGHEIDDGYKDGNNHEARFFLLSEILCHQQNYHHLSPLVLYVCDCANHCIRMIDITNGKTTTFCGKGQEEGDMDGPFDSARFFSPWDIVKDDENDHILYVSDSWNHKIKMIDMKKDMVISLAGDKNETSVLNFPRQMQIIDSFIYVVCHGFNDCITRIDKHSRQVAKIKFNDEEQVSDFLHGITYHELDQCFYISDRFNIYKLE